MNKERRKARRRPILETFSLFAVVPKKGVHRLKIHDVSEDGIGFDLDTEGESQEDFSLEAGAALELWLYFNPSLYLPLTVETIRVEKQGPVRRVGAVFLNKGEKPHSAVVAFLQMLDNIVDVVHITSPS